RVRSEVTPVTDVDLIVNGKVAKHIGVARDQGQRKWIELEEALDVKESSWIAARAYSKSPIGEPDAEAHTNPVYVYLDGKAPYRRDSLDRWVEKIDAQIAVHARRSFPEKAKVMAYFQLARDLLMQIRAQGGLRADATPVQLAKEIESNAIKRADERMLLKP